MKTIAEYFSERVGGKVRKVAVNASLGCPNRDGTVGVGGCIFCNNDAFSPSYCTSSITEQIDKGIEFTRRKGIPDAYLAYFQAYSNTYGETSRLIDLYEEALSHPAIKGLVLATRPDCLSDDLLDYFATRFGQLPSANYGGELNMEDSGRGTSGIGASGMGASGQGSSGQSGKSIESGSKEARKPFLLVELGIESTEDRTLELINRGHDFECCQRAVMALAERGIDCGAHIILGLPGETNQDYINHAIRLSALPIRTIKLHHLQIIRGTALADIYAENPDILTLRTPEEYAAAAREFLSHLREDIAVDRLVTESPKSLVIAPAWGIKPSAFHL